MIVVGFIVGGIATQLSPPNPLGETAAVIGYIIPGLLAIRLERQGVIETLSAATAATILVRLLLILVGGVGYGA
jgi:hypothetical protein